MTLVAAAVLIGATFGVYANSFSVPFVYDDIPALLGNPTIHRLWPLGPVLHPPDDLTVSGRPVINVSLAINYAAGGLEVRGYHLLNIVVHSLAGLTLFGLLRRTFPRVTGFSLPPADTALLAGSIALLWLVHPLQTQSVTYVIQRAEAVVGLFYLLTLYAFARGCEDGAARGWFAVAVAACALGMASKEVMVSAPLIAFLYDRTFFAGSFAEAWRRRWPCYLGLAATWLLLAYLVLSTGGTRSGTAGFGQGVSVWSYLLTQSKALVTYVRLSFWPSPLVFDYGRGLVSSFAHALPYALLVVGALVATFVALVRRPAVGFAGACFFAVLAPSSSIIPVITEPWAEHRMYLPLAAVLTLTVLLVYRRLGRAASVAALLAAVACGAVTVRRNVDYQSNLALWADTVTKAPANGRAHFYLAKALSALGRRTEALSHFENAARLEPADAKFHQEFGTELLQSGRADEAILRFQEALRLRPGHPDTHNQLGLALRNAGRSAEAVAEFQKALSAAPDFAPAHNNLGISYGMAGRLDEAIRQFERALRHDPHFSDAHNNLGYAFRQRGNAVAAIGCFQAALAINPNHADAHNNLATTYLATGQLEQALHHFQAVLRLAPDYAEGHFQLGEVLEKLGRPAEARTAYEQTLRLKPDHGAARAKSAALSR